MTGGLALRDDVARFLAPGRLWRRDEVLKRPSPIPAAPGVYGWWFDRPPAVIDTTDCRTWQGLTLLYTGLSPKARAEERPAAE